MRETGVNLPKVVTCRLSEDTYGLLRQYQIDHRKQNLAEAARELIEERLSNPVDYGKLCLKRTLVIGEIIESFMKGELRNVDPERAEKLTRRLEKVEAMGDDFFHRAVQEEWQQIEAERYRRNQKEGVKE